MKQYLFLATAIATASLFTGCSNNEYVGDQPEALNGTDGAIVFSMGKANTTRAEGTSPAEKLNSVFYVYGTKTVDDVAKTVFDTYKVKYTSGSSSASNTTGWEYVLSGPNLWEEGEKNNVNGGVANQTIKYWDYSASQYTFYAFSAKPDDVKGDDANIKVSNINTSDESYTVTIKKGAYIEDLYFADKKVVEKPTTNTAADPTAEGKYGGYVQLKFRNLASKVRVGFYETVPGYSIQIKNMYPAAGDGFATTATTDKFVAICKNTLASQNSKITVKYQSTGEAYVEAKKKTDEAGGGNLPEDNTLTLGTGVFGRALKTTSSSPTWDTGNGDYTFFWPQTGNDKPLKIKVDYTLTATDQTEASKKETITVTGATATVPADYVKWAANTAYTYIFKISDNTNGTTGTPGTDPAGLYPITFDAVVEDYDNKGSITTVSTPSVTASQNGVTFVSTDNGIKFDLNEDIFLKVMMGGNEVTGVKIKSVYVTSYDYNMSPDQNRGSNPWVDVDYDTTNNYYKLDNKTAKGWWILEVKDSDTSTTATTYVIIRVGEPEKGPVTSTNP